MLLSPRSRALRLAHAAAALSLLAGCGDDPATTSADHAALAGHVDPAFASLALIDDASAPPPDASMPPPDASLSADAGGVIAPDASFSSDAGSVFSPDAGSASGTFGNFAWTTTEVSPSLYETVVTASGAYFATIDGPYTDPSGNLYGLYSDGTNANVQTGYPTLAELTPLTSDYGNFVAYMAAEVQGQLAGQLGSDHQGCDSPAGTFTASCGACCDTHDICYCQNGCTSRSWFGIQGATCFGCNLSVTACITGCVATGGGRPSSCVAANSCDQSWEQCDDEGTLCDPNANPAWGQCMEIHHANDGWSSVCNIEQCPK